MTPGLANRRSRQIHHSFRRVSLRGSRGCIHGSCARDTVPWRDLLCGFQLPSMSHVVGACIASAGSVDSASRGPSRRSNVHFCSSLVRTAARHGSIRTCAGRQIDRGTIEQLLRLLASISTSNFRGGGAFSACGDCHKKSAGSCTMSEHGSERYELVAEVKANALYFFVYWGRGAVLSRLRRCVWANCRVQPLAS